ncbi:hypothetical protein pdam_00001118 [Pocillopora damicornis]|uniref:EF-hand domain-containing protein n=1 Tax=Pocillopora damicornis TaxID=46731 RepID=A0A3M6V1X4_POCDA|nr:hypothetical protein pdam_00001118 [Pocillopora damicornis]
MLGSKKEEDQYVKLPLHFVSFCILALFLYCALLRMVEQFTESQIDEFKECFSLFDGDSDGMITEQELALTMRSLGENITHVEIAALMKKAGKQKVRFPEFLKMMAEQHKKNLNSEREILAAFTALDRNKTGVVSRKQLQHLMTGTGDKLTPAEFGVSLLLMTEILVVSTDVKGFELGRWQLY